jgi:hypothetical protein
VDGKIIQDIPEAEHNGEMFPLFTEIPPIHCSVQKIDFNGKLYIDGYWVKAGWRKYIEAKIGRKFTTRQWKRIRNKIIKSTQKPANLKSCVVNLWRNSQKEGEHP